MLTRFSTLPTLLIVTGVLALESGDNERVVSCSNIDIFLNSDINKSKFQVVVNSSKLEVATNEKRGPDSNSGCEFTTSGTSIHR